MNAQPSVSATSWFSLPAVVTCTPEVADGPIVIAFAVSAGFTALVVISAHCASAGHATQSAAAAIRATARTLGQSLRSFIARSFFAGPAGWSVVITARPAAAASRPASAPAADRAPAGAPGARAAPRSRGPTGPPRASRTPRPPGRSRPAGARRPAGATRPSPARAPPASTARRPARPRRPSPPARPAPARRRPPTRRRGSGRGRDGRRRRRPGPAPRRRPGRRATGRRARTPRARAPPASRRRGPGRSDPAPSCRQPPAEPMVEAPRVVHRRQRHQPPRPVHVPLDRRQPRRVAVLEVLVRLPMLALVHQQRGERVHPRLVRPVRQRHQLRVDLRELHLPPNRPRPGLGTVRERPVPLRLGRQRLVAQREPLDQLARLVVVQALDGVARPRPHHHLPPEQLDEEPRADHLPRLLEQDDPLGLPRRPPPRLPEHPEVRLVPPPVRRAGREPPPAGRSARGAPQTGRPPRRAIRSLAASSCAQTAQSGKGRTAGSPSGACSSRVFASPRNTEGEGQIPSQRRCARAAR